MEEVEFVSELAAHSDVTSANVLNGCFDLGARWSFGQRLMERRL